MAGKKKLVISVFALIFVFILIYVGVTLTSNLGKSKSQVTTEDAAKQLNKLYANVSVSTEAPVKGQIDISPADVGDTLPDISKFPITVKNTTNQFVEIFTSTEKGGTGMDSWLADVATEFNNAKIQVNGKPVSVKIRNIASGTAADYIRSGKYVPDAYTPSNELLGEMVKASGVKTELVSKRLVGNVPGIVISKSKHDALISSYGAVNVKTVTEAISNNEFSMGYTDPFSSSTGINFLVTALSTFDKSNLLSNKAVQGFEKFQENIPFLARQRRKCVMQRSRVCWMGLYWNIKHTSIRMN